MTDRKAEGMNMNETNKVPYDLRLIVERRLERDEKIRWIGQPKAWRLLLKGGIFIIALAVLGGWFIYGGFTWLNENYFSPARDREQHTYGLLLFRCFLLDWGCYTGRDGWCVDAREQSVR